MLGNLRYDVFQPMSLVSTLRARHSSSSLQVRVYATVPLLREHPFQLWAHANKKTLYPLDNNADKFNRL